jgi:hypothetical protein
MVRVEPSPRSGAQSMVKQLWQSKLLFTSFMKGIGACFRAPAENLEDDNVEQHDAQKRKDSYFLNRVKP